MILYRGGGGMYVFRSISLCGGCYDAGDTQVCPHGFVVGLELGGRIHLLAIYQQQLCSTFFEAH